MCKSVYCPPLCRDVKLGKGTGDLYFVLIFAPDVNGVEWARVTELRRQRWGQWERPVQSKSVDTFTDGFVVGVVVFTGGVEYGAVLFQHGTARYSVGGELKGTYGRVRGVRGCAVVGVETSLNGGRDTR